MCNCLARTNADLPTKHNIRVRHTLPLVKEAVARVILSTETCSPAKRNRHTRNISLVASFCPFCGEKYPELESKETPHV